MNLLKGFFKKDVHDLAEKGQTNPLEEEIKKNPGRVDEQNSVSA